KSGGKSDCARLRYGGVPPTYAEARIMLNDVDELAKDCINQVRQRAGLDMTGADVKTGNKSQQEWIALIQNERRTELAGEGLRYDDILRWKNAEYVLNQPALVHSRFVKGRTETTKIENRVLYSINNHMPVP